MKVSPDGRRAVSCSVDVTLRVWDFKTGACLATAEAEATLRTCTLAPDGRTVVAGDQVGRVHFLRLEWTKPGPPIVTA